LYRSRTYAENYRIDEPYDVWRVCTAGMFGVYADPEDPEVASYFVGTIEPWRLKLIGTYMNGERCRCLISIKH
jgi:hypothetical protein